MEQKKIPVIVICGPTGTGKTGVAIEICKKFGGEVISADSMQIYKMMDIGTAKPTMAQREGIPHHMMDIVDPTKHFSAAQYCKMAKDVITEVHSRGKLPVLAGGTGLYIDSLIEGVEFFDIENDFEYRKSLFEIMDREGTSALYKKLMEIDSKSAEKIDVNDKKRIVRALEIYRVTGKTKSHFVERSKAQGSVFYPLYIGLSYLERSAMYGRIRQRADIMMEGGLLDEVKALYNIPGFRGSVASAGIGYKELIRCLEGEVDLSAAVDMIKQNSTRYAKRQLTWFRKNEKINWLYADRGGVSKMAAQAEALVQEFIRGTEKR